jgi:hypothetical protein
VRGGVDGEVSGVGFRKKQRGHFMILELFLTTAKEYKRFTEQLPLKKGGHLGEQSDEATYVAIQIRLMLLRKYINKKDSVYLENIIDEAKDKFSQKIYYLDAIKKQFIQINELPFEHVLSDGTKLDLYQSIEDAIYGLYLHADQDRILRISHTKESLRLFYTKMYVEKVEAVVFKLYYFLEKNNISDIIKIKHFKAPIIHLENPGTLVQGIKSSPYWSNMYGRDATDEDVESCHNHCTEEELEILLQAHRFLSELKKENFSLNTLKNIVFESTLKEWGNFSEAISLFENFPSPGVSQTVRFNEEKNVAYVKVFSHTDNAFIVSTPHIIPGCYYVTLIKDKMVNKWKVFAFGGLIDPFLKLG